MKTNILRKFMRNSEAASFLVTAILSLTVASASAQEWKTINLNASGTLHNRDCDIRLALKSFGQNNEDIFFRDIRTTEYRHVRSLRQTIAFAVDSFDMLFPNEDLALNQDAYVVYWNDSITAGKFKTDGSIIVYLNEDAKPEMGFQYLYLTPQGQFKRIIPLRPGRFELQELCHSGINSASSQVVPIELDISNIQTNRRFLNVLDGDVETNLRFVKPASIVLDLGRERAISSLRILLGNNNNSGPLSAIAISTSSDNNNFLDIELSDEDKNPSARSLAKTVKIKAAGRYLKVQLTGRSGVGFTIRELTVAVLESL